MSDPLLYLYRQAGTTKFTPDKPRRLGSIAYALPFLPFNPPSKPEQLALRLSPERWANMGHPDVLLVIKSDEAQNPEPEPIVADGGWCSPPDFPSITTTEGE